MKAIIITFSLLFVSTFSFGQVNQYSKPADASFKNTYVPLNFDGLYKLADQAAENNRRNEQKIQSQISQIKSFYDSVSVFPDRINNGWHNAIWTNNYDYCEVHKVFVDNNKVTQLVMEDSKHIKIISSNVINKAKTLIHISDNGSNEFIELYFIDDIMAAQK